MRILVLSDHREPKDLSSTPSRISIRRSIATTEGSSLVGKDLSSLHTYFLTSRSPQRLGTTLTTMVEFPADS
jgi:hypothetical protein